MMKKVTVKQLMLLSLFMAMAWSASAQMKVGNNPNTINKGSVLELEAKDKGVLYPRVALTASNAWAPLQGTAVEGMTIYNTATVTATTSATTSLSPGFYFWQGDKWNKLATDGEVTIGDLWVKDVEENIILQNPISKDTVYYRKNGGYEENTKDTYAVILTERFDPSTGQYTTIDPNAPKAYTVYRRIGQQSQNIVPSNFSGVQCNYNNLGLSIMGNDNFAGKNYYVNTVYGNTATSNSNDYKAILLNRNVLNHSGTGTVTNLNKDFSTITIAPNSKVLISNMNYSVFDNFSNNNSTYNIINTQRYRARGTGSVDWVIPSRNFADLTYTSSSDITNLKLTENRLEINDAYTGTINDLIGYNLIYKNKGTNTPKVNNMYGLYMSSVNWGTDKNYAIYTSAGDVRIGDLAGTGSLSTDTTDKIVVADTNGVLKTKAATDLVAEAGEWKDGTVSGKNLIYANQAKTAGNDVVITDDGKIGIGVNTPKTRLHIKGTESLTSVLLGDEFPTALFRSEAAGIAGSKENVFRVSGLRKYNSVLETKGYAELSGQGLHINQVATGTSGSGGVVYTKVLLSQSDGTSATVRNYAVFAKYATNTEYGDFDSALGLWNKVDNTVTSGILMKKNGAINFINGDFETSLPNVTMVDHKVGIGTTSPSQKLHVVGNILASGTITPSDKRFKQEIAELTSGMAMVTKLRSVSYQWNAKGKEQGGDDKEHLGFIAQELEKVLPNLVSTDSKGYKSVNYVEVIPVLTKAIQEQQTQIAELKSLVQQLLEKK